MKIKVLAGLLSVVLCAGFWVVPVAAEEMGNELELAVETEEQTYTLHYCLDGCTSGPNDEEYSVQDPWGYVSKTLPERLGYNFRGWSTSITLDTVCYLPGDAIYLKNDLTLYPLWEEPMVIERVDSEMKLPIGLLPNYWIFKTSENCAYRFYSWDHYGVAGVYDDEGNCLILQETEWSYGGEHYFDFSVALEKNKTYYLYLSTDDSDYEEYIDYADCYFTVEDLGKCFSIKYDANGGDSTIPDTVLRENQWGWIPYVCPKWFGYSFVGWGLTPDATEPAYKPHETITLNSDLTLYAIWKDPEVINPDVIEETYLASGLDGGMEIAYLFSPSTSGEYYLGESSDNTSYIDIYDQSGKYLSGYGDSEATASLVYNFKAGNSYYIYVGILDGYKDIYWACRDITLLVKRNWTDPVIISKQPEEVTTVTGDQACFSVQASGTGELAYKWQYSMNDGKSWNSSTAATANTDTLTFRTCSSYNGRLYRCVISNGDVIVKSNPVKLTVEPKEITIQKQPVSVKSEIGKTVTFSVEAYGPGLQFQWQYSVDNGKVWYKSTATGANTASVSVTIKKNCKGRLYRCRITDRSGKTVYTSSAKITVN